MPLDPLGDEPTAPRVIRSHQGKAIFNVGDIVVIHAPHAPKWHGLSAEVLKVNIKRYRVKTTKGTVNVPHKMVKEA